LHLGNQLDGSGQGFKLFVNGHRNVLI